MWNKPRERRSSGSACRCRPPQRAGELRQIGGYWSCQRTRGTAAGPARPGVHAVVPRHDRFGELPGRAVARTVLTVTRCFHAAARPGSSRSEPIPGLVDLKITPEQAGQGTRQAPQCRVVDRRLAFPQVINDQGTDRLAGDGDPVHQLLHGQLPGRLERPDRGRRGRRENSQRVQQLVEVRAGVAAAAARSPACSPITPGWPRACDTLAVARAPVGMLRQNHSDSDQDEEAGARRAAWRVPCSGNPARRWEQWPGRHSPGRAPGSAAAWPGDVSRDGDG